MVSLLEDDVFEPNVIVLGVFGHTNKRSEKDVQENIIPKLLEHLGRMPDKMLLPAEGNSSIYLQEWAESLRIKTQVFQSDWVRNGRIAQILRDDRIKKECTHAFFFLSEKTVKLEKMANTLAKKGKTVFTSLPLQHMLLLQSSHVSLNDASSSQASEPVHKSSKGTVQTLLKFQKKEGC